MTKTLKIIDYNGELTDTGVDLDKLDDILRIDIDIVTGDEIATVIYKNGERERYDSSNCRLQDFYDWGYCLYGAEENRLEEFERRTSSYDM